MMPKLKSWSAGAPEAPINFKNGKAFCMSYQSLDLSVVYQLFDSEGSPKRGPIYEGDFVLDFYKGHLNIWKVSLVNMMTVVGYHFTNETSRFAGKNVGLASQRILDYLDGT